MATKKREKKRSGVPKVSRAHDDVVTADAKDVVSANCETVNRA